MKTKVKKYKILLVSSLVVTLVLAVLFGLFYFDQRKENAALRIKMISMSVPKRVPKTWNQVTSQLPPPKLPQTTKQNVEQDKKASMPVVDMAVEDLVLELDSGMADINNQTKEQLDRNIAVANEIIAREPESYSAYKAKLISLLAKEGRFKEKADDTEVNALLETIAEFEVAPEVPATQETGRAPASPEVPAPPAPPASAEVAPSIASNQRQMLESNLESVATERVGIENRMQDFDTYTRQWGELNRKRQQLLDREEELSSEMDIYDESIPYAFDTFVKPEKSEFIDEDVVEIPFMRQLAHNEYTQAEEDAATFIEQYPTSISGYFYLIRSLELQGRGEEIPGVIRDSQLSPQAQDTLLDRLDQTRNSNPEQYWERLSY